MAQDPEASPLESIVALAHQIADECPACASRASQIIMWASEIRERRPSREELAALVDAVCENDLSEDRRKLLIDGLRALVRFAE
ncbi:hypothetical protein [Microvirga subterranea]|uniref:Uncharacterized protein n=1 Tax=Microvirga subterranea TaxID=186651 RepID=A0A370HVC2_9HYPH|nr:hypothetical protein [Microvirga subterranea]RDI62365.1 hypothetical protein DES45_101635 [Microvirga subterranea]